MPVQQVHVFISIGRFRSSGEMRTFIDQTYAEGGDHIPSSFMREVELKQYEPGCIEVIHADRPEPLAKLLSEASYADQWLQKIDVFRTADSAICVFAPNRVCHPRQSSLEYLGSFSYELPPRSRAEQGHAG